MRLAELALLAALATLAGLTHARADGQLCLNDLERQIERDHDGVHSMLPQHAAELVRQPAAMLLLDVREAAEFEVSHLPGAVRVDPAMSADAFIERFGGLVSGKTVLLYCSVGVRSSRLARRIATRLETLGAKGTYNVRGGLFAWHNYGIRLDAKNRRTELVHPYSRRWARYLDFENYTSFRAQ